MFKKLLTSFVVALSSTALLAGSTAEQTVLMTVPVLDLIDVSGDPQPLVIAVGIAGEDPPPVSDSSTTWSVVTNGSNRYVVASLDENMPTGTTLQLELDAPNNTGASNGAQSLSVNPAVLVSNMGSVAQSDMGITYTFSVTTEANPGSFIRTVTLSLMSQ